MADHSLPQRPQPQQPPTRQHRSADDVFQDVVRGRFPSNQAYELALKLLRRSGREEPIGERDPELVELGLFLDRESGLKEAITKMDNVVQALYASDEGKKKILDKTHPPDLAVPLSGGRRVLIYLPSSMTDEEIRSVKDVISQSLSVMLVKDAGATAPEKEGTDA